VLITIKTKENKMYYIYEIDPIDFNWEMNLTPCEYLKKLVSTYNNNHILHGDEEEDDQLLDFIQTSREMAKILKAATCWEGDISQSAILTFPNPDDYEFEWGLAIKQSNNGTTFICTPKPYNSLKSQFISVSVLSDLSRISKALGGEYSVVLDRNNYKCLIISLIRISLV